MTETEVAEVRQEIDVLQKISSMVGSLRIEMKDHRLAEPILGYLDARLKEAEARMPQLPPPPPEPEVRAPAEAP